LKSLRFDNVTKSFGGGGRRVEALSGLSLEVAACGFVCIVGPSGCGKTTLLSLAAGLERPDSGSVTVDGKEVEGPAPDRVLVFQEPALFPWLSVRRNVEFGLWAQGAPAGRRHRTSHRFLKLMHLTRFAQARVHELSGGMKQRAALARSLAADPDILLMDEPFASLDSQTRDLLIVELQEIWMRTQKTVLFVTHNLREAACLGDRVVVLSARPGRAIRVLEIDLPRPRQIESPGLMEAIRPAVQDLRAEVAKVAEEEARRAPAD
jgi:NitT/TauT family transport system ATP-binding protein